MKRSTLILALALPALVAANSAAQIMPVRMFAPVNPVAGLPKVLPSPVTGPLAGMNISLPSLIPALSPAPALLAAASPAAAFPTNRLPLPVSLPSHRLPVLPSAPSRDSVINPVRRIMPGVVVRFASASRKEGSDGERTQPTAKKDELDQIFDGNQGVKPGAGRGVIDSGRRISLPEDDLMRELGI